MKRSQILMFLSLNLLLGGCASEKEVLRRRVEILQNQLAAAKGQAANLSAAVESERKSKELAERSRRNNMEEHRKVLKEASSSYVELNGRYESCVNELNSAKVSDIRVCKSELLACEKAGLSDREGYGESLAEIRSAERNRGRLDVFESVQFKGYSEVEPGFFSNQNYFIFEVKIANVSHKWRIPTEKEESNFTATLGILGDVAAIFGAFK